MVEDRPDVALVLLTLVDEHYADNDKGDEHYEQDVRERAARFDLLLARCARKHLAALAFSILAHATILAWRVTLLHKEWLLLLNNYVRALHDGAVFSVELHLKHGSGVRGDNTSRQLELARLVAIFATARELLAGHSHWSQRNEVRAVHADTNSAVAQL